MIQLPFGFSAVRSFAVAFAVGISMQGCGDPTEPDTKNFPLRSDARLSTERPNTTQEYIVWHTPSDKLAQRIPKFGGAYISKGKFILLLAGNTTDEERRQAISTVTALNDSLSRSRVPIEIRPALYTFIQLRIWELRLSRIVHKYSVHSYGVQEDIQQIQVHLARDQDKEGLLVESQTLGIPREALDVQIREPGYLANLQAHQRPLRGGLQIKTRYGPSSGSTHTCTLGFTYAMMIINPPTGKLRRALTNSHCVQGQDVPMGGYTGQWVSQPTELEILGLSYKIGQVIENPAAVSGLPGCASGQVCRYSDAAMIRIDLPEGSGWESGKIYRTLSRGFGPGNAGSTSINTANPYFQLSGDIEYYLGDTLQKVGRTTGWTAGIVTEVCKHRYYAIDNGTRLCSGTVSGAADGGDSGSPVFKEDGGLYYAVGILFGVYGIPGLPGLEFHFSPLAGIKKDMPSIAMWLFY